MRRFTVCLPSGSTDLPGLLGCTAANFGFLSALGGRGEGNAIRIYMYINIHTSSRPS